MEEIVSLCKRRGFAYPSSSIYGGLANTWDFGHYGVLLKNNIRDSWWKRFVLQREDMVGIEASIFLNPKVWDASGHIKNFTDVLIDCKICKSRTRADHLIEDKFPDIKAEGMPLSKLNQIILEKKIKCPRCGNFDWTEVRRFNLLFETDLGILEGSKSRVYLRGEIAQGIFINFKNVLDSLRVKIPFGIAQQGKAFRNEITMGQFIHRTLEFDLMEFEYFIKESDWEKYFSLWKKEMWNWALELGLKESNLRWREHEDFERAHYSKKTMDIEYNYPFGYKEIFGIAYRTDFDLKNHAKNSTNNLNYVDSLTGESFIPHVIEPTFGLSRLVGVILADAFNIDEINGKKRIVLKLNPKLSPVKTAVFPLQKDEKLKKIARDLFENLKTEFVSEFDDNGNIGKMYRRQDEIGTPYCITVDFKTIEDQHVTVRDRDTTLQNRVHINELKTYIMNKLDAS